MANAVFKCITFSADMKCLLVSVIILVAETSAFFRFGQGFHLRRPFYKERPRYAKVVLTPGGDSGVSGELFLEQAHSNGPVLIRGAIKGLTQGLHGFHVHMKGELGNDCKDAGSHFNPFMKNHGDPGSVNYFSSIGKDGNERHVGDLGNIVTPSTGYPTRVFKVDHIISLQQSNPASVVGRAIVVHANADDLGRGNDEESLKTGNAGARVACGVIQKL